MLFQNAIFSGHYFIYVTTQTRIPLPLPPRLIPRAFFVWGSALMELRAWLLAVWVLGVGAVFVARVRRDYRAIQARRAALVAAAAAPRLLYLLFCRQGKLSH